MTGPLWSALAAAALMSLPSAAYSQLGEVQLGSVVSYGTAAPYGVGAGLVLGVAAGRLAYAGLRWTYQTGSTEPGPTITTPVAVRSRAHLFAVDVGLLFPAGALEIVPGVALGAALFAQRADAPPGGAVVSAHAIEFFAAPGLSAQVRLAGLRFIPEIQYFLAGNPDLPWPVSHRGPATSLRIVVPFEVDRIRY